MYFPRSTIGWYIGMPCSFLPVFSTLTVPSAGPDHVTADVLSSSSINVSWTGVPTSDRNGMILGYKVSSLTELMSMMGRAGTSLIYNRCKS